MTLTIKEITNNKEKIAITLNVPTKIVTPKTFVDDISSIVTEAIETVFILFFL